MKIYIPNVTKEHDLTGVTELLPIVPYVSYDVYSKIISAGGPWNEGMYSKLRCTTPTHERTNLVNADLAILPFKYNPSDKRVWDLYNLCKEFNTPMVAFYNDDNSGPLKLPSNCTLYRSAIDKSRITTQERVFPVMVPDQKPGWLHLDDEIWDYKITFCGHIEGHYRQTAVSWAEDNWGDDLCRFIIRPGFWAPGMAKMDARKEYIDNMLSGAFTLCMRGGGNFSYRFYEALSFGRIPVLIDTDTILPFENEIPWHEYIIRLDLKDIRNGEYDAKKFGSIERNLFSPRKNRELWEEWFSPEGYLTKIFKYEAPHLLNSES